MPFSCNVKKHWIVESLKQTLSARHVTSESKRVESLRSSLLMLSLSAGEFSNHLSKYVETSVTEARASGRILILHHCAEKCFVSIALASSKNIFGKCSNFIFLSSLWWKLIQSKNGLNYCIICHVICNLLKSLRIEKMHTKSCCDAWPLTHCCRIFYF